jgi:hypothetical protein
MLFAVHYADEPNFGTGAHPQFPEAYTHVANVDTATIDEVFRLMQNLGYAWWENKWVDCLKQDRSMSVGDVVVCDAGTFRCEMIGWAEITT